MYKAKQLSTNKIVAIKEISIKDEENKLDSDEMLKKAEQEAQTMGGCDNEFVVGIYDYKIGKDKVYV